MPTGLEIKRHDSQNIVQPSPQPGTNFLSLQGLNRWPSHKAFLPLWGSCYYELKPGSCSSLLLHLCTCTCTCTCTLHVHVVMPWDKLKPHRCHNSIVPFRTYMYTHVHAFYMYMYCVCMCMLGLWVQH